MHRLRRAKIVATLGPSSSTESQIRSLFEQGADVFRLNFSHGSHQDHQESVRILRQIEQQVGRPITLLMDLQGPKLRIGTFLQDKIFLRQNQTFFLDNNPDPGNEQRVYLPHPEIFQALTRGTDLLLDDGKLRLRVVNVTPHQMETCVITGGELSNRKGVNVPGVMLPLSALTQKDHLDLEFGLKLGVDWVALSFVQKPQDVIEAKQLIQGRSKVLAKLEKPMALDFLEDIVDLCDGIMVARGDLGVEMLPEEVPSLQKRIIYHCRQAGKPVVVATQMLDSMVHSPAPTRAEASDVATAIYDGVDAVMLSAESASGQYPVEAVAMMDRIIQKTEQDPVYRQMMEDTRPAPFHTVAGALTASSRQIADIIDIPVIVTFSETGLTCLRAARERPKAPILALTPNLSTARCLGLVWGTHAVLSPAVDHFSDMIETACHVAQQEGFAKKDQNIIVTAGIPFGTAGVTNILRIAKV